MKRAWPLLVLGTVALLVPGARTVSAQTVDTIFFHGLRYRLVGPARGGRVTTVTGVPSAPRTFYMGVASGGLFRTVNGGETWEPLTDGKVPVGSSGRVEVAPSNPNVIYYGTGSDAVRSNVSTGRGIYRSTDAGTTWSFIGLYHAGQIGAIRIHPTNPDIAWVAAYGDIFKPNAERGVFKTTDGGGTWRKVLFLSDSTGATDVELQPGNPDVVFAWMARLERKPWTIISGSSEGGLYKSTDGGDTWTKVTSGLPSGLIGKGNIAVTAAKPNRLYALIEAKPGGGVYRSDDAGASWTRVDSTGAIMQRPFYYTVLVADPTNADVVYGGAEQFFKSTDGGRTFTRVSLPHGDNHDLWINPTDGDVMVQANDGGAVVTYDGGKTWSSEMNQPTAEIYGVWTDDRFPYNLYGAQQDNNTIIISSAARPDDPMAWRDGPGCETGPIMPKPDDPDIVYGSCKGQFEVMSLRTGLTKRYWVGAQSLYGMEPRNLIYRFQRVSPMETSPHDPHVLYYGSQYVHRTRDLGEHWERISPDLTAHPPCCQGISGQPITRDMTGEEIYSTLYAIRESPHEPGVIWTGANDGPFYLTRDDGKTWMNVTPKDLPPGGRVQYIEVSPHRRGVAYYAVYRYLLGDYQPYIYRTEDYGTTWTRLTDGSNGIPNDVPTRVVREDPNRAGLLYAGTEFGMYVSFDDGAHWQPFQMNLPVVPITDIKIKNRDLVVTTQGRAFWILDDVSAVEQLAPTLATSQPTVFAPRDGYRTPTRPDLYAPGISYFLPSDSVGRVTIEILDARDSVINTYASAADAGRERSANPFGRGLTTRPTSRRGMNRFVWDGRSAGAVDTLGHATPRGPLALPGRYRARVTIGTATKTVPIQLRMDPRFAADDVTLGDLERLYAHNLRVRALETSVNGMAARVRDAQARLKNATGAAADTLARVNAIADKLFVRPPVRYGQPGLLDQVEYLAGLTFSANQRIGQDALDRYQQLAREADALGAELRQAL